MEKQLLIPVFISFFLSVLLLKLLIPVLKKEISNWKKRQKEELSAAFGNKKPGGAA